MTTAHNILTCTDAPTLRRLAAAAWSDGNNAGRGFAVGAEDDGINALAGDLGELALRADNDQQVAVYRGTDGSAVLVGYAHGPWAVRVR